MDPLERWKHSPAENEPASMNAIARAAEFLGSSEPAALGSIYHSDAFNNSTGTFSIFKAPSVSSTTTGLTDMSSGSLGSHNSAYSHDSRNNLRSMNALESTGRRRRRRLPILAPKAGLGVDLKFFQCTFCPESFKSKYD
jgi:hypothetical protein